MMLEKYIKDLLYRYDCVIVPEFGAFISNTKPAKVEKGVFNPPYKQVTFNALIQNNDGLLANHIARTDKVPYETALNFIKFETEEWIDRLLDNELVLEGIGYLYLVDDKITFEVDANTNYLTASFGLSSFVSNAIQRTSEINTATTTQETVLSVDDDTEDDKNAIGFLKYAAIFLIGFSVIGLLAKKTYDDRMEMAQIVNLQEQQTVRENKIQTATFVIDLPLPTVTVTADDNANIGDSNIIEKKYHIISGAFRSEENAQKSINQLKAKGYEASIVGKNKWDLFQVACQSYVSLEEANKDMKRIHKNIAKDAWVFVE